MIGDSPRRKALGWILPVGGAVFVFVLSGLLLNWTIAPGVVVLYFCIRWGAKAGQKNREETEAYRQEWLKKRNDEAGSN
ncbi:hypothetical protein ACX80U_12785 [Arthrobacter sp. TmT3-37]